MKPTRFEPREVRLTPPRSSFHIVALLLLLCSALPLHAQETPPKDSQSPDNTAESAPASRRLTIEVSGGDKNVAVENASVYLKYVEARKLAKDRKYELNVKTNRSGIAHVPDPPLGRVLIQIVAEGWKSYGKYYELSDPGAVIKIHLDRPPKWY